MVRITYTWILLLYKVGLGVLISFPQNHVVERVCVTGPFPQTVDTTSIVAALFPPIKYNITGNNTLFDIDHDTGVISVLSSRLATPNISNFVLQKFATDRNGNTAVVSIHLTMPLPKVVVKQCPKMQEFNARDIAPVGEEVGQLNCGHYVPNLFEKDNTRITVSGVYVPFNVTTTGTVVVASPLHFRNSIDDIIIFNVTIRKTPSDKNNTDCKIMKTRLVIRITVQRSDCPSGWTFQTLDNVALDFPPLLAISPATVNHCMETCSALKPIPCDSFTYNIVMKSCDLFNETDISMPSLVHRRLGTFMYRKICQTGVFPKYALRQIKAKIKTLQEITTEFGELIMQDLLRVSMETNMTHQDRLFAFDLMNSIISNTTFIRSSKTMTEKYLKAACQLVDFFIDGQSNISRAKRQREVMKLMKTFDSLMESLTFGLTDMTGDITVKSVHAHIIKTQSLRAPYSDTTHAFELVVGGNISRVTFPNYKNASYNVSEQLVFVTGALTLPGKTFTNYSSEVMDSSNMSHKTLSGHMVSVNIRPYSPVFPMMLQMDVFTPTIPGDSFERICVYLDLAGIRPVWRDKGCWLVAYNYSHVRCQCNHLTSFAVLMQIKEFQLSKIHKASLELVTVIGCCFSIASLSTTILILLWLRLCTDRYVLLMNLSVALVLAQVVFLTGIDAVGSKSVCRFVAILLHYLYLGVFTLMLAEGIFLYQKLHRAFSPDSSLTMFLLLGWGSPFVVVTLSLITSLDGYGTEEHCWLSTNGAIWAFVGPAITIISINTAILVSIIHTFLRIKIVARKTDSEKFKASVKVTVVLLPLLGVTWMFGVLAVNSSTVIFQYAFALLNSFQGFFIFLFHIALNAEVRSSFRLHRARVSTMADTVTGQ